MKKVGLSLVKGTRLCDRGAGVGVSDMSEMNTPATSANKINMAVIFAEKYLKVFKIWA